MILIIKMMCILNNIYRVSLQALIQWGCLTEESSQLMCHKQIAKLLKTRTRNIFSIHRGAHPGIDYCKGESRVCIQLANQYHSVLPYCSVTEERTKQETISCHLGHIFSNNIIGWTLPVGCFNNISFFLHPSLHPLSFDIFVSHQQPLKEP